MLFTTVSAFGTTVHAFNSIKFTSNVGRFVTNMHICLLFIITAYY